MEAELKKQREEVQKPILHTGTILKPANQITSKNDSGQNDDKPFLMPIEDVFSITGRGTIAIGRIQRGSININDRVHIVGIVDQPLETVVTGIEMFRKLLDSAKVGDSVGLQLKGVSKSDVTKGQVLAKPGSIMPHTKFTGIAYLCTKDEGGRNTPIFNYYRPQFVFYDTPVYGIIRLPAGVEMAVPGSVIGFDVDLKVPFAIERLSDFDIKEDERTIAIGNVVSVV